MPFIQSTFTRIWRFVDKFSTDDAVRRSDLDVALDDIEGGINAATAYLEDFIGETVTDNLYLGAHDAPPTEGTQGEGLIKGHTYIKTPEYILYVYTGTGWVKEGHFATVTDLFKTLAAQSTAAAFRAQIGLGSAATLSTETIATKTEVNAKADASHTHNASAINAGTLGSERLPAATESALGAVELASQVEAEAGTDPARGMTPLSTWQAIEAARGWSFEGSEAYTAGGQLMVFTHNFGAEPTRVQVDLVCTSANAGYSIGDVVLGIASNTSATADRSHYQGFVVYSDSPNAVSVRISGIGITGLHKASGGPAGYNAGYWDVRVKLMK